MATTDLAQVPSKLFIPSGGSYTAGGTSLGEIVAAIILDVEDVYDFFGKPDVDGITDASQVESNALVQVQLGENSATVRQKLFLNRVDGAGKTVQGHGSRSMGKILADGDYLTLQIRPDTVATKAHAYFPRALVLKVGQWQWRTRTGYREGAVVHFMALSDPAGSNSPWYEGDPATDFPTPPA